MQETAKEETINKMTTNLVRIILTTLTLMTIQKKRKIRNYPFRDLVNNLLKPPIILLKKKRKSNIMKGMMDITIKESSENHTIIITLI